MPKERLECFLDGACLCIVKKGFVNVQESEAYFIPLEVWEKEEIEKLQKGAERKDA